MTPPHDEQTETDELDTILKGYIAVIEDLVQHVIVERDLTYEPKLPNGEQLKTKLKAWSRQQTVRSLDSDAFFKVIASVYRHECSPSDAIAALRVGLQSAPHSSPSESAKAQGPQVDTSVLEHGEGQEAWENP